MPAEGVASEEPWSRGSAIMFSCCRARSPVVVRLLCEVADPTLDLALPAWISPHPVSAFNLLDALSGLISDLLRDGYLDTGRRFGGGGA